MAKKSQERNSCAIKQFKEWNLHPRIAELIESTCFNVFSSMRTFHLNNQFLNAAFQKLNNDDEAFSFNGKVLYLGLEDIFYITGLPVDGSPIVCNNFDPEKILQDMLGFDDPKRKTNSYYVKKAWLKNQFETIREEHMHDQENRNKWLLRYARAYLLYLMGTILFPENNKDTVFIGYLLFLDDLTPEVVNNFAWGSAVLAKLQDGFKLRKFSTGAVWIVQMFLLERIPLLRKEYLRIEDYQDTTSTIFPSARHWSEKMEIVSANMHLNIDWNDVLNQVESEADMGDALQLLRAREISWRPYKRLPDRSTRIFYAHFPIFDMDVINLHKPELSPRQLGIMKVKSSAKFLPRRVKQISKQGAATWDYKSKYEGDIKLYNEDRYKYVVEGEGVVLPPPPPPQDLEERENYERNDDNEDREREDREEEDMEQEEEEDRDQRDREERENRDDDSYNNGGNDNFEDRDQEDREERENRDDDSYNNGGNDNFGNEEEEDRDQEDREERENRDDEDREREDRERDATPPSRHATPMPRA